MMELFQTALPVDELFNKWKQEAIARNCGAFCVFDGIVRSEHSISALYFEIYEPILKLWFEAWQQKAIKENAKICMAHSIGEVKIGKSSFACAILARERKIANKFYWQFIEDFKMNAPIWKYDVIDSKKIYASARSKEIDGAGILK